MLTIIKVFMITFLLYLWGQGAPWKFSEEISKLSFQLSFHIYSLLAQTEGERKDFFGRVKLNNEAKGATLLDYNLVDIRHEKVSSLVKFEIILPLLCFSLGPLTNKHCKTWSSMINLCE